VSIFEDFIQNNQKDVDKSYNIFLFTVLMTRRDQHA